MIAAGDAIPDVEIKQPGANGMPEAVKTGELFAKGRTVLFGVPGAFTPGATASTCPASSSRQTTCSRRASTESPASR